MVVVTTLLDAEEFTKEDLAGLYRVRWNVEVDLYSVKQNLQMDILRCKTPELVRKEIWTHILAYNLIRTIMAPTAAAMASRTMTWSRVVSSALLPRRRSLQKRRKNKESLGEFEGGDSEAKVSSTRKPTEETSENGSYSDTEVGLGKSFGKGYKDPNSILSLSKQAGLGASKARGAAADELARNTAAGVEAGLTSFPGGTVLRQDKPCTAMMPQAMMPLDGRISVSLLEFSAIKN